MPHRVCDVGEADAVGQKGGHGDFIGGIEHAGHAAAGLHGLIGQFQAGETAVVGRFKSECGEGGEIQRRHAGGDAFGQAEAVGDGRAHIGRAHLRQHRAVGIAHHAVHHALRVDNGFQFLRRAVEQPVRFNQLQAFVHHGGAVHRNFAPHLPVGVFHRLLGRDGGEVGQVGMQEGAAGGGEDDGLHAVMFQVAFFRRQYLIDSVVFAVHRQDAGAGLGGGLHEEAT